MITNYLKVAWRNIIRQRRTSLINLLGLSLCIASALILFVIVQHEWSYDRYHQNYDHIYRIVTETKRQNSSDYNPGVAAPLPQALRIDMPQLKAVVPLLATGGQVNVPHKSQKNPIDKYLEQVIFTTADFFQLFDATWLAGDATVLKAPNSAVLHRETAIRFFG